MAAGPVNLVFDEFAPGHVPALLHHYCTTEKGSPQSMRHQ